jgi:predicted RNA-binding Zn-ribbon protein involved in translation (DUF1610 family)
MSFAPKLPNMNIKKRVGVGLGGFLTVVVLAAALFTSISCTSHNVVGAADVQTKGGATKLMNLKTVGDIEALQPGDIVVMTCPKCETVMETRIDSSPKGAGRVESRVAVHGCPGCGAKWETIGGGKAKTDKVTHVCSHCGSEGAICAVRKAK